MIVTRHTWYMIGRQTRNLLREPIWIAILLVQPMVWLLLYGQLFKNVTRLGGFGTSSYITFLAPAIVVMNAFFSASWSGMGMVFDIERKFVERFLATPASQLSLVLSQIVRSALTAALQGAIILLVALALGVRVHSGALGWVVILLVAILVNAAFGGFSQGVALLVRRCPARNRLGFGRRPPRLSVRPLRRHGDVRELDVPRLQALAVAQPSAAAVTTQTT